MPTLSWGASFESLLADTPQKEMPFVLASLAEELKHKLFEAFSAGSSPANDMPSLCEVVVEWLAETAGSSFKPLPDDAGEMAKIAMELLQLHDKAGGMAKALRAQEKDMRMKMLNADEAVSKALLAVIQQGSTAAHAASASQVTERMAVWKKGLQDGAAAKVEAAKKAAAASLLELEAGMKSIVKFAHASFCASQPKSDDDMLAAMMVQVQKHMQQLEVSSRAAGTGGTMQADDDSLLVEDTLVDGHVGIPAEKDKAACGIECSIHNYCACTHMFMYVLELNNALYIHTCIYIYLGCVKYVNLQHVVLYLYIHIS